MANHGQHQQETSSSGSKARPGGGGQAVVELCNVTESGLIFWSRQRFDIGAELQIRIRRDAIHASWAAEAGTENEWVFVSGFVVECPPMRRADGSSGFRVSMLLDKTEGHGVRSCQTAPQTHALRYVTTHFDSLAKQGLN